MFPILKRALPLLATLALAGCSNLPWWAVVQGQSAITDYRHFHNAEVAPAAQPLPLPADPAARLNLPTAPDGLAFEQWLELNDTVAFVVLQRGQVVWERYFNGYERDSLATSFSMAKSVVGLLVGLAIEDGKIASVDDPLTRYLPELAAQDPRFAQVTLRHLLSMRSGIRFREDYVLPWSEASVFYLTPDLHKAVLGLRTELPPDTHPHYSSGDTQLLGMVVERATGEPLARYLERRLWQPMGAQYPASWSLDSAAGGQAKAYCCLNARALDYARIGQMMLMHGQAGGRQVVPSVWVDELLKVRELPGNDAATRANLHDYGHGRRAFYTWQWRHVVEAAPSTELGVKPGTDFYALGLHGQYIYVAPEQQMVIVRLGREAGRIGWWPPLLRKIAAMNPLP